MTAILSVAKVFISYRRSDVSQAAGRLRDALVGHFGDERIFRDKESVRPGVDWREDIRLALNEPATVVLALIGSKWVSDLGPDGQRHIERADNANRAELEIALSGGLRTIPVLVDGAQMPHPHELPASLRTLTEISALRLRDDDWHADLRRLLAVLEERGVEPAHASATPRATAQGVPQGDRDRARPPFTRRTVSLFGALLVVIAAVAVVLLMSRRSATPEVAPDTGPQPPPISDAPNVEIVMDRSDAMQQAFGSGTKLGEARKAVLAVLPYVAGKDNLAYRVFGGACDAATSSELVLPFAPGKARLEQKVKELTTTSGRSTLVSAVIEATGDFNERRAQGRSSRIVVIAGSLGDCDGDPVGFIAERLKSYPDVAVSLRFVGVGLASQARTRLAALVKATGVKALAADDATQLERALQHVLVVEPKVGDVQKVIELIDVVAAQVNRVVITDLGNKDYIAAERDLGQAVNALAGAVVPIPDPQQSADVRELIDLAREKLSEQRKMLDMAKTLIAAAKASDTEGQARARAAYNSAASLHNAIGEKTDAVRTRILESGS